MDEALASAYVSEAGVGSPSNEYPLVSDAFEFEFERSNPTRLVNKVVVVLLIIPIADFEGRRKIGYS